MASTLPTRRVSSRPQPGRPALISRERIIEAALQENLDTLTMRERAERLGVTHGALYRWVSGRDELLEMISEVMVERILPAAPPTGRRWRAWLQDLAWSMHDEFSAVSGYASRMARPHRHSDRAFAQLERSGVAAFGRAGCSEPAARLSWQIFSTSVVNWLAAAEAARSEGIHEPPFELFLDVLLRGLPARELGSIQR